MSIVLVLIALILLAVVLTGIALIVRAQRPDLPFAACGKCRYNVSNSVNAGRCPECGSEFAVVGILPPSEGRSHRFLVGGIVLCLVGIIPIGFCMIGFLIPAAATARRAPAVLVQPAPPPPPAVQPNPTPPTTTWPATVPDGDPATAPTTAPATTPATE